MTSFSPQHIHGVPDSEQDSSVVFKAMKVSPDAMEIPQRGNGLEQRIRSKESWVEGSEDWGASNKSTRSRPLLGHAAGKEVPAVLRRTILFIVTD